MSGFARHWGRADAGRKALLLHCSLAHSGAWEGVARRLADQAHLTAPDLVGHGNGPDRDPARDFHDQCMDLALARLGSTPCHLVGHSFGATIALRLAIEHTDRVASLTMIEPVLFAAAGDTPAAQAEREMQGTLARLFAAGQKQEAARVFLSVWGGGVPLDAMPARQAAYMTERMWVSEASARSLHGDAANLVARLGSVTCRVLLIEGATSPPIIAEIQAALARALPQARRMVVDGAAHMVPISHPGPVAEAISALWTEARPASSPGPGA